MPVVRLKAGPVLYRYYAEQNSPILP